MGEQHEQLWYKPVITGCEELKPSVELSLYNFQILGLNVYIDSEELRSNLTLIAQQGSGINEPVLASLYYFTKNQLPFRNSDGSLLKGMEIDYPGDIYASLQLDRFYFYGIDKLGTFLSMVYGIRAFANIENGMLGLHSSLLYDKVTHQGHLIVGKNRIGKSTIGQAVEEQTDRFVMVADDWSEVQILSSHSTVEPVSPVFSPSNPNSNYEFALSSFDKPFYWKYNLYPLPEMEVGKVIEMVPTDTKDKPDTFLPIALSHIPFLNQILDVKTFACPILQNINMITQINQRRNHIFSAYDHLTRTKETIRIVNDHSTMTIDEVSRKILEVIS